MSNMHSHVHNNNICNNGLSCIDLSSIVKEHWFAMVVIDAKAVAMELNH